MTKLKQRKPKAGAPLTPREVEVAALVAEGLSNKLIADRLGMSEHTTKFHVRNVCAKYETTSRVVVAAKHVMATMIETVRSRHQCSVCGDIQAQALAALL